MILDFLSLKPKAFGLDISDLSLKVARLKKRGDFFDLSSWGELKLKPGIIEEGEIKKPEVLSGAIRELLNNVKGDKIKIKDVVVSLPEKKAFLQVIEMPKMKRKELEKAVMFEAENYIPLPIEKVYLDFEIVPSLKGYSKESIDVLIAAIAKDTVDPYFSCIKNAGLNPRVLEIESQSITRALIKNNVSSHSVLLVDFGESNTNLIIFSGYSIKFTSSISVSSFAITKAIADYLKMDFKEAEKIKIKQGLDENISKAVSPVLNELVDQIKKYFNYYQTHYKKNKSSGHKVKKVILAGRGSNLKGLDEFISSELNVPVQLGNPWVNILSDSPKKVPDISFKESLGYSTALGLALRGVEGEF